ncbi:fimbria/pilus outer membrane usher protein, partial [Escherichia coli]
DIPVEHTSGVKTDWFGYTIKPYATPYRLNRIALDSSELDEQTEIENSVLTTVPTRGAIVKANFVTRQGARALVHIVKNGKSLP